MSRDREKSCRPVGGKTPIGGLGGLRPGNGTETLITPIGGLRLGNGTKPLKTLGGVASGGAR